MTPEEANATVEEAIAKGMARYSAPNANHLTSHERKLDEYDELARIYMGEISDWTVQLAWLVADRRWEQSEKTLISMRIAVDKLAGAVSKMVVSGATQPARADEG